MDSIRVVCSTCKKPISDPQEGLMKPKSLAGNNIAPKRRIPYPENKTLTADFVVGKNWIEYFGLAGVISDYDLLIKKKQMLSKKYKLSLIEIYPEDLFPVNRLSEIIKIKKLVKNNKNP